MQVALTGATGFLGRYLVQVLGEAGHSLTCWTRETSDRSGLELPQRRLTWVPGSLADVDSAARLVEGCDAVVHAALDRPGRGFRGAEGDLVQFCELNVLGSLRLIEAARKAGVGRFVFVSTCAVHEKILDDRPLDEAHPLWPLTHYGAHKAAIEKFVHSFGFGMGYPVCAIRPTGIYGAAHPVTNSKWFSLVRQVVHGETVDCRRGGKEVHALDVARAIAQLLTCEADLMRGEAFACYDRYISEFEVANLAAEIAGVSGRIEGELRRPKHEIDTTKLRSLGFDFGGEPLLRRTVQELVDAVRGEA